MRVRAVAVAVAVVVVTVTVMAIITNSTGTAAGTAAGTDYTDTTLSSVIAELATLRPATFTFTLYRG
jgi:hypothetical protein